MIKKAIINFITPNAWHPFGQERLNKSLCNHNFDGDIFLFNPSNLKTPSHQNTPYAFKLFALKEVQKKGYDIVLWLDASFWAIKSLDGLFSLIEKEKIVVQNSGYSLGQWSSDNSLKYMNFSREDAFKIMMFSGGLMGFDFRDKNVTLFFEDFYNEAKIGIAFKGSWTNKNQEVSKDNRIKGHRHDMVVGTILMKKYKLIMQPNNSIFSYYKWYQDFRNKIDLSHVYFLIEGGVRKI